MEGRQAFVRWVCESGYDGRYFEERSRPAVREDQGDGVGTSGLVVNEVQRDRVGVLGWAGGGLDDAGVLLKFRVYLGLVFAPVVFVGPVLCYLTSGKVFRAILGGLVGEGLADEANELQLCLGKLKEVFVNGDLERLDFWVEGDLVG